VANFSGTLLLVSHDRAFIDRVVTSLLVLEGDGRVQDFVGGYSDWARWRDARDAARAASRASNQARAAAPAAPVKRRLSYKDQRELDGLPAQLESMDVERATLQAQVADPQFYSRDHAAVAATLKSLSELEARIETAFARWSELESK
jgi:ABC transport system ATP-binding/permease protein